MRWCSGNKRERTKRGSFTIQSSALIDEKDVVRYLNKQYTPAFFSRGEMKHDIGVISLLKSNEPVVFSTRTPDGKHLAKLAVWGRLELVKLDEPDYEKLRKGRSLKKGVLVDHINNFTRAASQGVPVYSMPAGKAYVWIGRHNRRGKGSLRFFLIDADYLAGQLAGRSTRVATGERSAKPHTKLKAEEEKQSQISFFVELNKLETSNEDCRAYFVISNTLDSACDAFKLDVVVFNTDGTIENRFAFDLSPMSPSKRSVKVFDLPNMRCEGIGSILINDVIECSAQDRLGGDCLARLKVNSLCKVELRK